MRSCNVFRHVMCSNTTISFRINRRNWTLAKIDPRTGSLKFSFTKGKDTFATEVREAVLLSTQLPRPTHCDLPTDRGAPIPPQIWSCRGRHLRYVVWDHI